MDKKVKKKRVRFKGLLVIILALYLIGSILYYFLEIPINYIEIKGNSYLKDNYIISYLDLENTSIFKLNKSKIKKQLLALDLVSDVKITKNYLGKLYITITEETPLFYSFSNKKIVLSNGCEIEYDKDYLGIPILINLVPDEIYNEFVKRLNTVSKDILTSISEMEYSPSKVNGKVVDDKRFLFRMNDGNKVYINTINIKKINDYLEIYEAIVNKNGNVKGCLYLDSNSENNHFNNCESTKVEE